MGVLIGSSVEAKITDGVVLKAWAILQSDSKVGFLAARPNTRDGGASSSLTSPRVVSTLKAVEGPIAKGGVSNIGGVGVTEYSGHATLAALQSLDPNISVESAGQFVPAASSVVMEVRLWIDGQGRLIRMSILEPLFTGINHDGSDFEEAAQVPSSVAVVKQQSARQITVTLSDFGAKDVKAPAQSKIAVSR